MRAGTRIAALLVAALAISASKPAPEKVEFPGPGVAADPSGRYLILWRAASYAAPHELLLTDVRDETSVVLWEFRRRVAVLWAPGGRHIAITDEGARDVPDVLVFTTADPGTPVRMSEVLERSKGSWKDRLAGAGFEAVGWQSDSTLRLRASTRPDTESGYETSLDYRIGGGLKEVRP